MLRGLIVTHGDLGRSLLDTAETILGKIEHLSVLSNRNHSRESLSEAVEASLAEWGDEGGVILTDIPGGSCSQAVLHCSASRPDVDVVTGVNLPMVIDFLHNRERFGAHEMADRLVLKGQTAIRRLAGAPPGAAGSAPAGAGTPDA